MASLRFSATIEIYEINPYVHVTADQAARLKKGWRKPMPVKVQVNGQPQPAWQINMIPMGTGDFYLYLHGDVRKASGTKVGDRVTIDVSFDTSYESGPAHPMPEWFRIPLEKNERAVQAWRALPPSRQKEILRYFSWLKSDEAKERNVEKVLFVLSGNEGRFMARNWRNGQ